MTIDIDAIEARANAATPSPWVLKYADRVTVPADIDGSQSIAHVYGRKGSDEGERNRTFIAHARADIPKLCAEVRRLFDSNAAILRSLKRLAITKHIRPEYGGGFADSGWSCKLCDAECESGSDLIHTESCLLFVRANSAEDAT